MKTLANICWFLFGGFVSGMAWVICGVILCVTVIGLPLGMQCFKFASLSFWPFGKQIYYKDSGIAILANIIWLVFFGLPMAIGNAVFGFIWCITIVGIPFGKQFFKIAALAIRPFGAYVM